MCLMPCSVAIEFSILRATSVSICAGAAPGSDATTVTVGRSMSGNCWIFIALEADDADQRQHDEQQHRRESGCGSTTRKRSSRSPHYSYCFAADLTGSAGDSTTRTVSPSARKPAPVSTTRVVGSDAVDDLDAIADATADFDLGLHDLVVRTDRKT